MRFSKQRASRPGFTLTPCVLFFLACLFVVSGAVLLLSGYANEEQRVAIYSTAANYTLPVISRNNHDYVGLFEVLEPLGTVTAKVDGARWKIRYGKVEGEFTNEKARAKVRGRNIELPANFILENGRGLVPLNSLSILLPPFLGGPVNFHESSRRLFIGNVAVHFSAQLNRTSEPPFLVLEFTSPVNPTISTGPGQLRMTFNREPLVPPGSQTLKFDSPMIPSATYSEGNGAAEIQINGSVPLFASFSNNGRRITIAPAPQPEKQAVQPPTPPGGLMPATPAPSAVPSPAAYFAVIDPSHGGEERGAALSDQISEKDVTLAFARRLRRDLEARGITSLLVRDSDSVLSLDQRATIANAARSKIYICIHAASQGNGVRLYSGLIPAGDASRGPFLDWNTAQGSFLPLTQAVESQVAAELQKKQISARTLAAPLRPLNNIVAPALAIEIAPPGSQVADVNSAAYQDSIATAVVAAVVGARARLESGR